VQPVTNPLGHILGEKCCVVESQPDGKQSFPDWGPRYKAPGSAVLHINSERHVDDCVNGVVRGIEAPEVGVEAVEVVIVKTHIEESKGDHQEHEGIRIERI